MAATNIDLALQSAGAINCTPSETGRKYLMDLNVAAAAAFYDCPCSRIDPKLQTALIEHVNNQLELLRTGKTEVCQGATGSEFPSLDWAEQNWDGFSQARIDRNRILRQGT